MVRLIPNQTYLCLHIILSQQKLSIIEVERNLLTEELGVYFETHDGLSPLSARIFSLLVLSDNEGVTFDGFVERLEASKSSISTKLQLLQSSGRITYCTKPGDRKRYFKIAPDNLLLRLDKKIEIWEKEKSLHLKIYTFKKKYLQKKGLLQYDSSGLLYSKNYASLITDMIKNLNHLKTTLEKTINYKTP